MGQEYVSLHLTDSLNADSTIRLASSHSYSQTGDTLSRSYTSTYFDMAHDSAVTRFQFGANPLTISEVIVNEYNAEGIVTANKIYYPAPSNPDSLVIERESLYYFSFSEFLPDSLQQFQRDFNSQVFQHQYTNIYTYSDIAIGIDENELSVVSIYPNPAKDYIILQLADDATTCIIDTQGRLIQEIKATAGTQRIELNTLVPGVYHLYAITGKGGIAKRSFLVE